MMQSHYTRPSFARNPIQGRHVRAHVVRSVLFGPSTRFLDRIYDDLVHGKPKLQRVIFREQANTLLGLGSPLTRPKQVDGFLPGNKGRLLGIEPKPARALVPGPGTSFDVARVFQGDVEKQSGLNRLPTPRPLPHPPAHPRPPHTPL